jgi:hypothetical protein
MKKLIVVASLFLAACAGTEASETDPTFVDSTVVSPMSATELSGSECPPPPFQNTEGDTAETAMMMLVKDPQGPLAEMDLSGLDLRWFGPDPGDDRANEYFFQNRNLQGMQLRWTDMEGVSFRDASLSGANACRANFTRTNLSGAYLSGTNLTGANFRDADLQGSTLDGANLSGAYLVGARFRWANLTGATMTDADLSGANLNAANLTDANLKGADLNGAFLVSTKFCRTTMPDGEVLNSDC